MPDSLTAPSGEGDPDRLVRSHLWCCESQLPACKDAGSQEDLRRLTWERAIRWKEPSLVETVPQEPGTSSLCSIKPGDQREGQTPSLGNTGQALA